LVVTEYLWCLRRIFRVLEAAGEDFVGQFVECGGSEVLAEVRERSGNLGKIVGEFVTAIEERVAEAAGGSGADRP
jgi:hypothetical protein